VTSFEENSFLTSLGTRYSRLQKACRFSVLRISHFFLIAFWSHQSSKSDFLLLFIVTLNDFYIDDLNDKFSSYMCSSFSKISYSARFFNDVIQIVWFLSSSRSFDSSFDQVHDSLFQMIIFEICHTDENFSCMSTNVCEIDTQMMIVWLILIKSSFIIFWFSSSSRFSSLIFIKFIIQIFRCSFLKFRIQTKNFSCMSISSYESDTAA
jgi:hypothetical protein